MKTIDLNILRRVDSLESWEERSKAFNGYVNLISIVTHLGFVFLFILVGVKEMMYFNLFFSIPVLVISYILGRGARQILSWTLFYLEIAAHATVAVYYIGTDSGFHFYLLCAVVTIHLGYGWSRLFRRLIYFGFFLLFAILYLLFQEKEIYHIGGIPTTVLYILNVFVFILIASVTLRYFISVVFRFEKQLKLANVSLKQKNDLISQQKDELECIHKEIESSINYATRIQQTVLPEDEMITDQVSDNFLLYLPKYKVSGDFYWWTKVNGHTIIAAADCTGHGVPGAFMSMLGITYLRDLVLKSGINEPAMILDSLRDEVIKGLKQKGEVGEQKDGMDISVIRIDHKKGVVDYAGANNSMYLVSRGDQSGKDETFKTYSCKGQDVTLYEIKADKMPIGIFDNMSAFKQHSVDINSGDMIYLYSDGYADQFGGEAGKKMGYHTFKQLLLKNSCLPLEEQYNALRSNFEDWCKGYEQIDDVLVMGIRI